MCQRCQKVLLAHLACLATFTGLSSARARDAAHACPGICHEVSPEEHDDRKRDCNREEYEWVDLDGEKRFDFVLGARKSNARNRDHA